MPPIFSFFGRRLVYIESFFLFAGPLLFDEKIRQSSAQPIFRTPVWETPNCLPNIVPAFFGDRFVAKDAGLRTPNPFAEEVRGLEVFLYKADHTFDHR